MSRDLITEAVTIRGAQGALIFAVVTRPAVSPEQRRAFVMLGKAGPGDIWRWLAQALARRGFVVVRFEPAGLGDSPGGDPSVDVPVEGYFRVVQEGAFVADTRDVLAWVMREHAPAEMFALGICGNCSSVLLAAAEAGETLKGVVLVTPAVLYSSVVPAMRNYDAQDRGRGYLLRLRDPRAYLKLLSGKSEYAAIRGVLRWALGQPFTLARYALAKLDRSPKPSHPAFNWRLWEGLQAVMNRKTRVLFLIAELDAEAHDFKNELKELVLDRHPLYSRLCTVRTLAGTDHSFLFEEGRQLARQALSEWLYGSPATEPIRRAS